MQEDSSNRPDGLAVHDLARWTGSEWQDVGGGVSRVNGYDGVYALEPFDDGSGTVLYVGGFFDQAGSFASGNVARWSAAGWSPVGTGMNNVVRAFALATVGGAQALYAGGSFTTADGVAASKVARWDGAGWSAVGSGPVFDVYALAGWNALLMAGGNSSQYVKVWNGSTWSTPAGGYPASGSVTAFELWNGGLGTAAFVGGSFNGFGAATSKGIARWNGSGWGPVGTGISGTSVFDLLAVDEPSGSALYVGGDFATFNSVASSDFARWGRPLFCGDTAGPTVTITAPADGAVIDDPSPVLEVSYSDAGSGVDPSTLAWTDNGIPIATQCVPSASTATCLLQSPLSEGVSSLTATLSDLAGNPGASTPVSVTVDTAPPTISFSSPGDGAVVLTNMPSIQVTYSDATAGVDGSTFSMTPSGTSSSTFNCTSTSTDATCDPQAPLGEGGWTFQAQVADLAGHPASTSVAVTIDALPPVLAIVAPASDSWTNDDTPEIDLTFSDPGTGVDGSTLALTLDGSPLDASCQLDTGSAICVPTSPLATGPHSLVAALGDHAGHTAVTDPVAFSVDLDFEPPIVTVTDPTDGLATGASEISISGSVSEPATLTINGDPVTVEQDLSFTVGPLTLFEGPNPFRLEATDRVGNSSTVVVHVVRDTSAPTLAFYSPKQGEVFDPSLASVELLAGGNGAAIDPASLVLTANGVPAAGSCQYCAPWFHCSIPVQTGPVVQLRATVSDLAGNVSDEAAVDYLTEAGPDVIPPTLTIQFPTEGLVTTEPEVRLVGGVSEPATVTVNGQPISLDPANQFDVAGFALAEGPNSLVFLATDAAGNPTQVTRNVTRDTLAPSPVDLGLVSASEPTDGTSTVTGAAGAVTVSESGLLVRVTNTTTTQSTTSPVAGDGSFVASVGAEGGDRIALVVVDPAGNSSAPRDLVVPGAPSVPADPALGAPAVDPKQPSTICDTLSFLFSGPGALQRGGAADGVDCARAAWLRGRVVDRSGAPLAGVRVAVPGQPQIGTTLTRADGAYDLIVNGGGGIVLRFAASGHPVAERRTDVPWGGSRVLDEIRLVSFDSASTAVDLAQISETTPARGSSTTDPDGTRQATLLFAAGTTAVLDHGSGSEEPISSLTVRATEYTVGADGPSSMPAELPPTSAYTYAVELSVDEAEAAGAKSVRFSRPVPVYVEDFLGFPTGTVVPAATYDRDRHVWVPTTDGRVVEILSISAGRVDLDLTGSGQPATGQELAALGIDDGERQALAALYPVGQKLWRVPVDHFSAYDFNFPVTLPDGASAPGTDKPESDDKTDKPNCQHGSIIECENQVLGETLPIAGTPFALHYRSDRVPGRAAARHLDVPLAGPDGLPADVQEVRIDIQVAGKQQTATLPASSGTFSVRLGRRGRAGSRPHRAPAVHRPDRLHLFGRLRSGAPRVHELLRPDLYRFGELRSCPGEGHACGRPTAAGSGSGTSRRPSDWAAGRSPRTTSTTRSRGSSTWAMARGASPKASR